MSLWGWNEELARERISYGQAEADERRLARAARGGATLRSRAARRLFDLAVLVEREETWRVVWERLEAPAELPADR
jgi:hypothetical protein